MLKRRQTEGRKTRAEQSLVDSDVSIQQVLIGDSQVENETAPESSFDDSQAPHDGSALGASKPPGAAFIDDGQVGGK